MARQFTLRGAYLHTLEVFVGGSDKRWPQNSFRCQESRADKPHLSAFLRCFVALLNAQHSSVWVQVVILVAVRQVAVPSVPGMVPGVLCLSIRLPLSVLGAVIVARGCVPPSMPGILVGSSRRIVGPVIVHLGALLPWVIRPAGAVIVGLGERRCGYDRSDYCE